MTLDSAIAYFRDQQADQFSEQATVTRPAGNPTFNRETEAVEDSSTTVVSGPCKIRPAPRATGEEVQAAQREIVLAPYVGKWPVNTTLRVNDVVTVTASTYDTDLATATFRVAVVDLDGWQIARAVGLERVAAVLPGGGS
jgi:translation initiation factor IF-1